MTMLHRYLAQLRGVDPITYDPPAHIVEQAEETMRSCPEGVTAWLDKACEGFRESLEVTGVDVSDKSIPQLVAMWFAGNNAQVIAATQALRDAYDKEFAVEKTDEIHNQLIRAGIIAKQSRFDE